MILSDLPIEKISLRDIPFYHRRSAKNGNSLIRLGNVKRGGNEPYCYVEEKQCAGHICRVLCPDKTYDSALVIRDDGTLWKIWLSNFEEAWRLEVTDRFDDWEYRAKEVRT